jgi:hypothetical protein
VNCNIREIATLDQKPKEKWKPTYAFSAGAEGAVAIQRNKHPRNITHCAILFTTALLKLFFCGLQKVEIDTRAKDDVSHANRHGGALLDQH